MDVEIKPGPSGIKTDTEIPVESSAVTPEVNIKYFECSSCILRVQYEYFGRDPPWYKNYRLLEDVYAIEDPFSPPKQKKIVILGTHCVKCDKLVCKDTTCSIYYEETYCIRCAKQNINLFPESIREKLNKIVG